MEASQRWLIDCRSLLENGAVHPSPQVVAERVDVYFVRLNPAPTTEERLHANRIGRALVFLSSHLDDLILYGVLLKHPSGRVTADDATLLGLFDLFGSKSIAGLSASVDPQALEDKVKAIRSNN